MKIPKHIVFAALAGAVALALGADVSAQAPSSEPAAKQAPAKHAAPAKQLTFATPDDAAKALADAVRAKSAHDLLAVVGPESKSWLFSGDKVADANDWKKFLDAYDQKVSLDRQGEDKVILDVGNDGWPFPAPIVKRDGHWAFDANAGHDEIVDRRVGRNELDTIQTLLAIVDAQREYASTDADGNGFDDYARRFRSTPGKKDGLYWPTKEGDKESPLGPLVAEASSEGYLKSSKGKSGHKEPYHGYYYRILTSQGKNASGGAFNYMVGDKLLGGFAIEAWPAKYRSSGVMTFVVNHEGVVYQKDLGPRTPAVAGSMTQYNPDATWRKAE